MYNVSDKMLNNIIEAIEVYTLSGEPFTARDVASLCEVAYSTVVRVLRDVLAIQEVVYMAVPRSWGGGINGATEALWCMRAEFASDTGEWDLVEGQMIQSGQALVELKDRIGKGMTLDHGGQAL